MDVESSHNVAGNYYNKYESQNPIARWLTDNFKHHLLELIRTAHTTDIHELGCGEGYLSSYLNDQLEPQHFRASDYSAEIVQTAERLHGGRGIEFSQRSIYDIEQRDRADLIVCCEVLEHLEQPELALARIRDLHPRFVVFSVPREPFWRITNMARLKYLAALGNTPGHLQHWSKRAFLEMIGRYFDIDEVRSPYPWTMLLCRPQGDEE